MWVLCAIQNNHHGWFPIPSSMFAVLFPPVQFLHSFASTSSLQLCFLPRPSAQTHVQQDILVIPRGVACEAAEEGIAVLAKELRADVAREGFVKPLIALPSGTGTTAYYLQKHLAIWDIPVVTTPCVGHEMYLREQWAELEDGLSRDDPPSKAAFDLPRVLNTQTKYRFGRPHRDLYDIWKLLQQTEVDFDLLYVRVDAWVYVYTCMRVRLYVCVCV
jgi:hypothetical protein